VKRNKWGIWWLFLLAWNSANFGSNIPRGRYWWALVAFAGALACAAMAYSRLTTHSEARLTITVVRPKP
jgi:hypothetical protein